VEQHSAPDPQAFPSVVQAALPEAGTGIVAHWPFVPQTPEQHCAAPLQLSPMEEHAPLAHVPPEQVRLQQSALAPQLSAAALQNCDALHLWVTVSHAVEQQSAFCAQVSPPATQAFGTGAAQTPPLHPPEQHSLEAEHAACAARHCPAGSTQTLFAHAFVQQSALDPQTAPTALHWAGSTQVPVHACEQQSDGVAQVASSALHVSLGFELVPRELLPQAAVRARAAMRRRTRRMDTSVGSPSVTSNPPGRYRRDDCGCMQQGTRHVSPPAPL